MPQAYESLKRQTVTDWEWVILENAGGKARLEPDPRIKILSTADDSVDGHNRIGRLKNFACQQCSGDVLVELDADDLLTPDCLEELLRAFADDRVQMAYSNDAQFTDGTWKPNTYSEAYGWRSRPFVYEGHALLETVGWPPGPQMMRRLEWAPNHVRAWRKTAYQALGGHAVTLKNGDDHDLCCRSYVEYGAAGLRHIDKCLYLYRVHPLNSSGSNVDNSGVQQQVAKNYVKYVEPLMERWARDEGLPMYDLGGRLNGRHGYVSVDLESADVICDLDERWPFADDSVGIHRAHHLLEHLVDPIHFFNEAYRTLVPGGWLKVEVPSSVAVQVNGTWYQPHGAFRDPTHRNFFTAQSFWYYTNKHYAKYISRYRGRFQVSRVDTYLWPDGTPIVAAELICLKPPYSDRAPGEVLI